MHSASMQDAGPGTPILVFLSPGVDVAASVEALGRKLGFTSDNGRYAAVSLGQVHRSPMSISAGKKMMLRDPLATSIVNAFRLV